MDIATTVASVGTTTELKRIASAYVIDYRNLSDDEIKDALIKTAPQYSHEKNVKTAIDELFLHPERKYRLLFLLMLKQVLLNKDHFMCSKRETEDDIISYEQGIVDKSNEDLLQGSSDKSRNIELFSFVIETAWEHNDSISPDEKNLLEKLKTRLRITDYEYHIIEAKLGKFPKPGNNLHTRDEIETVRRALQSKGVMFSIRDNDNTDFDIIPDEIASTLRNILGIEIRRHGFRELLNCKYVRSKQYFTQILGKCGIDVEGYTTLDSLRRAIMEQVRPSILLGGLSPRDGLDMAVLKKWSADISLPAYGAKSEIIQKIVEYYDKVLERDEAPSDERELYYQHFDKFANRELEFLRNQNLLQKDLECEKKFEQATNYLFEKKLLHKPLTLIGTAHADGVLSFHDRIIFWDNKSKESQVNLKDHIKQFDGYIKSSEKPVAGFFVIGPDFTPDSSLFAMKYQVETGITISLIRANDLKDLAEKWSNKGTGKQDDPFPLGYLIQPGILNMALVEAAL